MEFDKNSDLKLDDAELEDVAKTVHESLAEYNYFQSSPSTARTWR